MVAVGSSLIKRLIVLVTAIGTASISPSGLCVSSMRPVLQIDLEHYGGKLHKYGSRIDHAVAIMPDDSVWASFPIENESGLVGREGSQSPGRGFLHVSLSGRVISQCTWHMPANSDMDFFPRADGGFTIRTGTSIISLNASCRSIAEIARPGGVMVDATSDNKTIVLSAIGAAIRILNADTLKETASIPLPVGVVNYRISIWSRFIVIRDTPEGKCFWTYRSNVSTELPPTWHPLYSSDPELVRTFGDSAIISSNWSAPSPSFLISDINGITVYSFAIGRGMRPDTSLFPEVSCISPTSGRAGIFLYDRRRTWWGEEKITGEHVAVIDFTKGQTLLSLPVTEYDPLLNCSLSRDGKIFVVLRGLNLSIFDIPEKRVGLMQ